MKRRSSQATQKGTGFRARVFWVLGFFAALVLAECFVQGRTALRYNPNWEIREAAIERSVAHARFFRDQRVSITENGLNLGAWHGNNEVLVRRPLDFDRLETTASIQPEAYLSLIFNFEESGYSGVRLSRSPLFESMYFEASPDGKFLRREIFPFHLPDSDPHAFVLESNGEGETSLSIDGKPLRRLPSALEKGKRFGFRNGERFVFLESVVVKSKGEEILREDFHGRRGYAWMLILSALLVLAAAAALVASRSLLGAPELLNFGPALAAGLILVGAGGFYGVDRFWLSRLSFFHDGRVQGRVVMRPGQQYEKSEALRNNVYVDRSLANGGLTSPEKIARERKGDYRVLFLGGSQTFGEGAAKAEESWPSVLLRLWSARGYGVAGKNSAQPGASSNQILSYYDRDRVQEKFDLVVVNLGTNDQFLHNFLENLEALAEKIRASGSEALFVLEPNCVESDDTFLLLAHRKMLAVASRFGFPVLDLHHYFARKRVYDSGMLWWDHVHLSSLGQSLFAGEVLAYIDALSHAGKAK